MERPHISHFPLRHDIEGKGGLYINPLHTGGKEEEGFTHNEREDNPFLSRKANGRVSPGLSAREEKGGRSGLAAKARLLSPAMDNGEEKKH